MDSTLDYYTNGGDKDGLIALPTGSGKSYTLSMVCKKVIWNWPNTKIMILTHVKELVEQDFDSLKEMWPQAPAGIYSAGLGRKQTNKQITVGGIMSVKNNLQAFGKIGIVIIDEAHLVSHENDTTYRAVIEALRERNPALKVIGLTATPWRMGGGHLLECGLFEHMLYDATDFDSINRLIDEGYLSDLVAPKPSATVDTRGIKMQGGDFNQADADALINIDSVTQAALDETMELAADRKHWMIFAQSIDHCDKIQAALDERGIECVIVHSELDSAERDRNIAAFKAGEVRALVNMGVLTTGFDFRELDCLVILRATQSTPLWVQILGRGLRVHPDKENCLVLDFAGNTARLGAINDPVLPKKAGTKSEGGVAPVKICPECQTYLHASAKTCKMCGLVFDRSVNIEAKAAIDALVLKTREKIRPVKRVTYRAQRSKSGQNMVVVSYHTDIQTPINEFVCVEHEGWPKSQAIKWLRERLPFGVDPPGTVEGVMAITAMLHQPTEIVTTKQDKYHKVKACTFAKSENPLPF